MSTTTDTPAEARRRAAFHEAGHAVVAWALGIGVGWVRLLPETDAAAGRRIPITQRPPQWSKSPCASEDSGPPQ
jgi:hypothetical protein